MHGAPRYLHVLTHSFPPRRSSALSMFTSSATQHGGQEATILTSIPTFLHHGMIIVGLPYSNTDLTLLDEVSGGTPYGASTISGSDNKRQPSERELGLA